MPLISRLFIFSSFFFLLVYALLPLLNEWIVPGNELVARLLARSTHLFTLGFLTQMIIAVAVWMFPRSKKAWSRPVGERIAGLIFICLNLGLLLRYGLYFWLDHPDWLQGIAGGLQFIALLLFAALIANRIQPAPKKRASTKMRNSGLQKSSSVNPP